ncbi:MAG: hypothetical protein GY729_00555, partial [Desulfobacteraceae bacterium]|nr:hypothetical protein [Desulfobacteraceae bacterium]
MNFGNVDMNMSFVNMMQKDLSKETVFNSDNAGFTDDMATNQVFAEKLSKAFQRDNHPGNNHNGGPGNTDTFEKELDEIVGSMATDLENGNSVGFLAKLKAMFLMMSQGNLGNISISPGGELAVKQLLTKLGFDEAQVTELMSEFAELTLTVPDDESRAAKFDEFFDNLFELAKIGSGTDKDSNSDEAQNLLEISAIPFIESLLNS